MPRFALQADCGRILIACSGENVSKKHGLTNRDVCVACCDMCVASGLASLADSALVASDSNASVCADLACQEVAPCHWSGFVFSPCSPASLDRFVAHVSPVLQVVVP